MAYRHPALPPLDSLAEFDDHGTQCEQENIVADQERSEARAEENGSQGKHVEAEVALCLVGAYECRHAYAEVSKPHQAE